MMVMAQEMTLIVPTTLERKTMIILSVTIFLYSTWTIHQDRETEMLEDLKQMDLAAVVDQVSVSE